MLKSYMSSPEGLTLRHQVHYSTRTKSDTELSGREKERIPELIEKAMVELFESLNRSLLCGVCVNKK